MTNYLIRHITDSTNHTFTEVIKPRENERYEIVSAESKEEAEEMAKQPKGLLSYVPSKFNDGPISKALRNNYNHSGEKRPASEELIGELKELAKETGKDSE